MDALTVLSRPFVMQTDLVGDEHFLLPAGTVTFLLMGRPPSGGRY